MGSDEIKYLDIAAFRDEGYLQEANRQFFHVLGLALEWAGGLDREAVERLLANAGIQFGRDAVDNCMALVRVLGLDKPRLSGVWDYRDDPEGINYGPGTISVLKFKKVRDEMRTKSLYRKENLGYIVQPAND